MRHMKAIAFALAAVMLASFAPVLFAENADADADYTFYRYKQIECSGAGKLIFEIYIKC